jgi:hypothetical protein
MSASEAIIATLKSHADCCLRSCVPQLAPLARGAQLPIQLGLNCLVMPGEHVEPSVLLEFAADIIWSNTVNGSLLTLNVRPQIIRGQNGLPTAAADRLPAAAFRHRGGARALQK